MLGRNIFAVLRALPRHGRCRAIYVREEHGGLKRVATYGFSREQEEPRPARFTTVKGLAGQVAGNRLRIVRLDNSCRADYFKVSSGLGEGLPHSVLVVSNT